MVKRGDVWLEVLDPTVGSELRKTRPCMVVSPPEIHDSLRTAIIAPMTTGSTIAPFRVPIQFASKRGFVLLDQLRAVDKSGLVRRLGAAPTRTLRAALDVLQRMFQP